jgi:hypothetical protein
MRRLRDLFQEVDIADAVARAGVEPDVAALIVANLSDLHDRLRAERSKLEPEDLRDTELAEICKVLADETDEEDCAGLAERIHEVVEAARRREPVRGLPSPPSPRGAWGRPWVVTLAVAAAVLVAGTAVVYFVVLPRLERHGPGPGPGPGPGGGEQLALAPPDVVALVRPDLSTRRGDAKRLSLKVQADVPSNALLLVLVRRPAARTAVHPIEGRDFEHQLGLVVGNVLAEPTLAVAIACPARATVSNLVELATAFERAELPFVQGAFARGGRDSPRWKRLGPATADDADMERRLQALEPALGLPPWAVVQGAVVYTEKIGP